VKDLNWEYEGEGVAADAPTWKWATEAANYSPNGAAVSWGASGKNDVALKVTFPGDTQKIACAVGQLSKSATTTATRKLKTAYRDSDYTGEFTKAKKGIQAKDAGCLVWDYVGEGGGGGGGGDYDLISDNMTVWWPSDDMATDYPHTFVNFIAGGGFEVKAQNSPTDGSHACMNIWHKKHAAGRRLRLHLLLHAARRQHLGAGRARGHLRPVPRPAEGQRRLPRRPELLDQGAVPARGAVHLPAPGSDLMVRDRTSGYRHSFANHAQTPPNTMQFRIRPSDGGNDGVDNSNALAFDPTVPNPVPNDGSSFVFVKDVKYKLVYTRTGTTCTCVKTKVSDGTTQTWTFVNATLGPTGAGAGGWCGFHAFGGRWFKVEPVPGVPFCSAAPERGPAHHHHPGVRRVGAGHRPAHRRRHAAAGRAAGARRLRAAARARGAGARRPARRLAAARRHHAGRVHRPDGVRPAGIYRAGADGWVPIGRAAGYSAACRGPRCAGATS
jgi:hypothetical protein